MPTPESPTALASPDAAAPAPSPDPFAEALREELRDRRKPRALSTRTLFFAVSLVLFVALFGDGWKTSLPLVLGVLLFHELGHWAAMRAFGYANLQILFIPFLGAAAMGRRTSASAVKEGLVTLAGPIPGIVVGLALLGAALGFHVPALASVAVMLVGVNGFNLLPVLPLDGGQLWRIVIFSRHAAAEIAFMVLAMIALALWPSFGGPQFARWLAILFVGTLLHRWRLLEEARTLRPQAAGWPTDLLALDDGALLALRAAAMRILARSAVSSEKQQAALVESLHAQVTTPRPTLLQSLALLAGWAAPVAAVLLCWLALRPKPPEWRPVADVGSFTASFPAAPVVKTGEDFDGALTVEVTDASAALEPGYYCGVQQWAYPIPIGKSSGGAASALKRLSANIALRYHLSLADERVESFEGRPALRSTMKLQETEAQQYFVAGERTIYRAVSRSDGQFSSWATTFFQSFHVRE